MSRITNRLDREQPGLVNCMITTDVYLPGTRLLLIPQGARVLGEASKASAFGQQRWKIRGNHLYGVKRNGIYANRCFSTSIDENLIEDFGDAGEGTSYGIACTLQGDVASVISGNKVFMFHAEPSSGNFIYIGIPQVNYDAGELTVSGNAIRGSGGSRDTGLSYRLGNGKGLTVVSASNNVQGVALLRVVGAGVSLVDGY
jgi:hypothetical protein